MGGELGVVIFSILLVLANAFFVAAEYALVGARTSRLEALIKKGNKTAARVAGALQRMARYVAGVQVAISMLGVVVGAITEPYITEKLGYWMQGVPPSIRTVISIVIVTYLLVVVGELLPKYITIRHPEKVALGTIRLLDGFIVLLSPLVWLVQRSGALLAKPFGIDVEKIEEASYDKDELLLMIRTGGSEGALQKTHAELVTRTLKLDQLTADDIMVHRLDIKWLDLSLSREEMMQRLKKIPFGRIPVCKGDIDEVLGIAYLHDIVKNIDNPNFTLEQILRPAISIPENLPIDRIVGTMRDAKSQIVVVMDEYGGTSGIITLEDVVEEIFGELEDKLESERPHIEFLPAGRISARADVRLDELLDRLGVELEVEDPTQPLAQIVVDSLGRVPRPGDTVPHELGVLRVENMARRRVTRVSLQLGEKFKHLSEEQGTGDT
jgi:putative hemolysin